MEELKRTAAEAERNLKITVTQLNEVHTSWQELHCDLEVMKRRLEAVKDELEKERAKRQGTDLHRDLEETRCRLEVAKVELEKERAKREDADRRYHNVKQSLTMQTEELAHERQKRRLLEMDK